MNQGINEGEFDFSASDLEEDGTMAISKFVEKVSSWLKNNHYENSIIRPGLRLTVPIPLPYDPPLKVDVEPPVAFSPKDPGNSVLENVNKYIDVANLTDSADIEPIIRILLEAKMAARLEKEISFNAPFVAILSPSGTGKTQLGYTLASQHGQFLSPEEKLDILTVHLVMSEYPELPQPINKAVQSASENFLNLCAVDYMILKNHYSSKYKREVACQMSTDDEELAQKCRTAMAEKLGSTQAFKGAHNEPLFSIGFLDSLLEARKRARDSKLEFKFEPCETGGMSVSQFRAKWEQADEGNVLKLICIFLDEFHLESEAAPLDISYYGSDSEAFVNAEVKLRSVQLFGRNLCRALGVVCCVMGTDSAATNLLAKESLGSTHSSRDNAYLPWVYVIHRLPSAKIANIPGYTDFVNWTRKNNPNWNNFVQWLLNSNDPPSPNPRIMSILFQELVKWAKNAERLATPEDALISIIPKIVTYLIHSKESLKGEESALGQCAMYFSRWRIEEMLPSYLVHTFFAYLCSPGIKANAGIRPDESDKDLNNWRFILYRDQCKLFTDPGLSHVWHPKSMLKKDDILFLLMSWNIERKYSLSFKLISVYHFYFSLYVAKIAKLRTKENVYTLHNHEGHYLEHLSHLALLKASHQMGFAGTQLDAAIPAIISALYDSEEPTEIALNENCDFSKLAPKLTSEDCIPFLAPTGIELSGLKSAFCEGKFAVLSHTPDEMKIDGIAKPLGSAQCRTVIIEAKNTEDSKDGGAICKIIEKALLKANNNPAFIMIASLNATDIQKGTLETHLEKHKDVFIFHTGQLYYDQKHKIDLKLIYPSMEVAEKRRTFAKTVVVLFHLSRMFGKDYSVDHNDKQVPRKRTAGDQDAQQTI